MPYNLGVEVPVHGICSSDDLWRFDTAEKHRPEWRTRQAQVPSASRILIICGQHTGK